MRPLDRKLTRDLWRLRGQVVSIALVVASGIAAIVTFKSALDSLEASRARYYADSRFADVFATLELAPEPARSHHVNSAGVSLRSGRSMRWMVPSPSRI
ncbi:MAG TPA: hypothetical protein VEQ60_27560, partial [Longimicrobium sp.]|nr:hypothetical protein [Longimicrobium sp.]